MVCHFKNEIIMDLSTECKAILPLYMFLFVAKHFENSNLNQSFWVLRCSTVAINLMNSLNSLFLQQLVMTRMAVELMNY